VLLGSVILNFILIVKLLRGKERPVIDVPRTLGIANYRSILERALMNCRVSFEH
jgi:hypothetical protein